MKTALILIALIAVTAISLPTHAVTPESFPCVAHNPQHTGVATGSGPPMLGAPRFVATVPGMEMVGPSTPVVEDFKVYVYAEFYDQGLGAYTDTVVLAFNELDGSLLWSRTVAERAYNSWSSPTLFFGEIDGQTVESVFVGSGDQLSRLDAHTGAVTWQATLDRAIANASPVVGGEHVFITDYTGFGPGGKLYAFDALDGTLTWSHTIGRTNGNTPVYESGTVYVATGDGGVYALDAADGTPLWQVTPFADYGGQGSAGGVSVAGGAVYGASYGFYGAEDNSLLVKLNATNGAVLWTAASERTDTTPVVANDTVFLSGGVSGYGSKPKLQCFDASTGAQLWSYDSAGGWFVQPCLADGLLYVGLLDIGGYYYAPAVHLQILDVTTQPGDADFVHDTYGPAGSSPSVANGNVYSIGMLGDETALYAFGPAPDGDTDHDGLTDDEETTIYGTDPNKPDDITDVYWDQLTSSVRITFASQIGVEYSLERADADEYADGLTWTSLPGDVRVGGEPQDTFVDNLTAHPLTAAFRFYRVTRSDATNTSRQTAGVFELALSSTPGIKIISTPLIPDPDHRSVVDVFGEGAARQIPRFFVDIADLDESTALINRMRNTTGTWATLLGNAFDIEPGRGYMLNMGAGAADTYTLRLTGTVPETAREVFVGKKTPQGIVWIANSMPRATTLDELGLKDAVTGSWFPFNRVRLLAFTSSVYKNYQHDGAKWYELNDPALDAGSTPIPCGQGIIFLRFGADNATDTLVLPTWYTAPPND